MSNDGHDSKVSHGLQKAKDALSEKLVQMAHKDSESDTEEVVYNVVFTGNFLKDEKEAITALAAFFKQGEESTKRLLKAGQILKHYPNKARADKLAKMLKMSGLECNVEMESVGEPKKQRLMERAAFMLEDTRIPEMKIPRVGELDKKQKAILGSTMIVVIMFVAYLVFRPATVSGDSFASYKSSVEKVIRRTSVEEKPALKKAIALLTGAGFEFQKKNTFGGNEEVAANLAYGAIDGMSKKEIMIAAEEKLEHKRGLFKAEIEKTQQEIAELETEIQSLMPKNSELKKLVVSDTRFSWSKGKVPYIGLKVTNNTDSKITRIDFQGYLNDETGKQYVSEAFSYAVAMGIAPGSSKFITVYTKPDGVWATEELREKWRKIKFKATVENAQDNMGRDLGVDLRPLRTKIRLGRNHINKTAKQKEAIKL